jgi:hypothetical protein
LYISYIFQIFFIELLLQVPYLIVFLEQFLHLEDVIGFESELLLRIMRDAYAESEGLGVVLDVLDVFELILVEWTVLYGFGREWSDLYDLDGAI